jgi:hypothetical protein
MCYVHLEDNCKTCGEYKSIYGHEPDRIEWTNHFIHNKKPASQQKKIKLFGITIGTIEDSI